MWHIINVDLSLNQKMCKIDGNVIILKSENKRAVIGSYEKIKDSQILIPKF